MSKTAVVISSCDKFRDAWSLFFYFFFKNWDCPYDIYLISNYGIYNDQRVRTLQVGNDKGWASNMLFCLNQIDAENIIYFQEDYFINRSVDSLQVENCLDFFQANGADYLGLYPLPKPDYVNYNGQIRIGKLSSTARMRTSLQTAIWRKTSLSNLLIDGETGWDMEREGTNRSRNMLFLRFNEFENIPICYCFTGIIRGAWNPESLQMCIANNLLLPLKRRSLAPEKKYLKKLRKTREAIEFLIQVIFKKQFSVNPIK